MFPCVKTVAAAPYGGTAGVVNLPFDPRRAMIARTVDLERSGLGG
jgi:hypothetical protein